MIIELEHNLWIANRLGTEVTNKKGSAQEFDDMTSAQIALGKARMRLGDSFENASIEEDFI